MTYPFPPSLSALPPITKSSQNPFTASVFDTLILFLYLFGRGEGRGRALGLRWRRPGIISRVSLRHTYCSIWDFRTRAIGGALFLEREVVVFTNSFVSLMIRWSDEGSWLCWIALTTGKLRCYVRVEPIYSNRGGEAAQTVMCVILGVVLGTLGSGALTISSKEIVTAVSRGPHGGTYFVTPALPSTDPYKER
jgi:hypothetical protein